MIQKVLTPAGTATWCRTDDVGWFFRETNGDILSRIAALESDARVQCEIRSDGGQRLCGWEVSNEQPDATE